MKRHVLLVFGVMALCFVQLGHANPTTSTKTSCGAGGNFGSGVTAEFIVAGSPNYVVKAMCRSARPYFKSGFQQSATHLICGARLRGFPHVVAGLYVSTGALVIRRTLCQEIFLRSTWVRFK